MHRTQYLHIFGAEITLLKVRILELYIPVYQGEMKLIEESGLTLIDTHPVHHNHSDFQT